MPNHPWILKILACILNDFINIYLVLTITYSLQVESLSFQLQYLQSTAAYKTKLLEEQNQCFLEQRKPAEVGLKLIALGIDALKSMFPNLVLNLNPRNFIRTSSNFLSLDPAQWVHGGPIRLWGGNSKILFYLIHVFRIYTLHSIQTALFQNKCFSKSLKIMIWMNITPCEKWICGVVSFPPPLQGILVHHEL